jgi:ABC-type multidrug transport system ATPase subunit
MSTDSTNLSPSPEIIVVDNLSIQFGSKKVVKNVSFRVRKGEINGFLGISGAGKTTIIRVLTCQIPKKNWTGKCIINGYDLAKSRNHRHILSDIGYVPQLEELNLYYNLSPFENVKIFAATYGLSPSAAMIRAKELFQILDIPEDTWSKETEKMSGGEKKRLSMAIGLINNPNILFLDEPTTGVDASKRYDILNYLKKLNQMYNTTIIIITHDLEASNICDTVAIIKKGTMIEYGSPDELVQTLPSKGEIIQIRIPNINQSIIDSIQQLPEVAIAIRAGTQLLEILLHDIQHQFVSAMEKIIALNLEVREIARLKASFKRYFQLRIQSDFFN